eukprot:1045845-Pyramimonas_sp.AAC.1
MLLNSGGAAVDSKAQQFLPASISISKSRPMSVRSIRPDIGSDGHRVFRFPYSYVSKRPKACKV